MKTTKTTTRQLARLVFRRRRTISISAITNVDGEYVASVAPGIHGC
jgi:hypothetical protein